MRRLLVVDGIVDRVVEYDLPAAEHGRLEASIVVNGRRARGQVRLHADTFASSATMAFCKTWIGRDA
ncbi:MAG TPA: hypothetical protein VLA19_33270 [Herpetosiphonaceae bacterium]|nr:hypothetical protein [Herpetosiphonaceae bacterium]